MILYLPRFYKPCSCISIFAKIKCTKFFFFKQVIKTLDPKLNPASAEIMLLRKQLAEKERRIEILEVKHPYSFIFLIIMGNPDN